MCFFAMEDARLLTLFVTAGSPQADHHVLQASAVADALGCTLRVVDVRAERDEAARANVQITPTLLLGEGATPHRVVGDLSDRDAVVEQLRLPLLATR